MESKYSSAQKQINEHIKSASELVDLCNYNAERYESLLKNQKISTINNSSFSDHSIINVVPKINEITHNLDQSSISYPICTTYNTCPFKPALSNDSKSSKTIMFSDKLGQGLRLAVENKLAQNFINIYSPGQSFNNIVKNQSKNELDSATTLIILCGINHQYRVM
ncbi:unnamed protein product [Diatraea saccharalis]|uniref:Uncharacterized protein n=1 Tax=Diatraea saccharalis TaxID=40085 RepID=A0A9N9QPR1_9NEOP|nr:unnamed protein product [Diatraea saccharalis]